MRAIAILIAFYVSGVQAFFGTPLRPISSSASPSRPHSCAQQVRYSINNSMDPARVEDPSILAFRCRLAG